MSGKSIISPISIDLGAKYTGVYFAHYQEGSSIENIEKEGKVYLLEKDKYTLLMENRTAARHQRRGYDRRQMAKRLFRLIWEKHFKLEWDNDVQQTTSFLLNRRGFTFLTEEYDAEILRRFPEEAYKLLPDKLKDENRNNNGEYDFSDKLTKWANEGEGKVRECFDAILLKAYHEKTRKNCQEKRTTDVTKEGVKSVKLANTPKDIFEKLFRGLPGLKNRIETEEYIFTNNQGEEITAKYNKGETFNILSFINNNPVKIADEIKKKLPQEQKAWLFNPTGSFDLEKFKSQVSDPENIDDNKGLHLHHLAFALYKTLNELESGGRHRNKYFEEVEKVLENPNHAHSYLENFCGKLQDGSYPGLDKENLAKLIGHISNLELKPLRKYFNDKDHQKSDYWNECRLSKLFDRWILREWRVDTEKDKEKNCGKRGDYKKLQGCWNDYKNPNPNTVIDFWLGTDPFLTIPPYQDNNNRRPPRCQSLILNPEFLDKKYLDWKDWLEKLRNLEAVKEYLGNFQGQLKNLESGKDNPYFSDEETNPTKKNRNPKNQQELKAGNQERRKLKALDARVLQFIFDRVKADDPLNLNAIYSHVKKWRQKQSNEKERQDAKCKLEKAIEESIPDGLKSDRDYDSEGLLQEKTFLHLVCKYYKQRQRAKDGRLFIHPEYRYVKGRNYENTGRFDDRNCLLTYCNHKPRQKKYQSFHDVAQVLQVAPKQLEDFIRQQKLEGETINGQLFKWLDSIEKLKANCNTAAKEQKDRRGSLKLDIQNIFNLIHHKKQSDPPSKSEIKEILNDSKVSDASKLHGFCERAKELCVKITQPLYCPSKQAEWGKDLDNDPATAVYLLAQIHNIAFKDRSGNSSTCAVCSADNAQRMQMVESIGKKESSAKAQRLPAISTRLIDGAVMRMARIVGGAIAEDKWKEIKGDLKAGKKVCVPIITESNRFEFEVSREKLVKNQRIKQKESNLPKNYDAKKDFNEKTERIKKAGQGICPYEGTGVGEGETDHIIPRRSKWGTLNDEANLIWASHIGNHHKTNQFLSLQNLNQYYKQEQFGTKDDQKIKQWIIEQIGDGKGENFSFGKYRSLINLNLDQQKAFRHALFLEEKHPLREKVINTINNRTRTLVNGTQRYFAEVIANSLHKKAKDEAKAIKEYNLSFDYFEVSSDGGSSNISVPSVRGRLERKKDNDKNLVHPELQDHAKGDQKQSAYSHLVDAEIAFMIALSQHYKQGSLKINDKYISPFDYARRTR